MKRLGFYLFAVLAVMMVSVGCTEKENQHNQSSATINVVVEPVKVYGKYLIEGEDASPFLNNSWPSSGCSFQAYLVQDGIISPAGTVKTKEKSLSDSDKNNPVTVEITVPQNIKREQNYWVVIVDNGANSQKSGKAIVCDSPLIRGQGRIPAWYVAEVGAGFTTTAAASYLMSTECLYIKNNTDKAIQVKHKGYVAYEKWYFSDAEIQITASPSITSTVKGRSSGEEHVSAAKEIKPGETGFILSMFASNGKKMTDASLVLEIDGMQVQTPSVSSDVDFQNGIPYFLTVNWDGSKLNWGESSPQEDNPNLPQMFDAVVRVDYDNAEVALCDTAAGLYSIVFKDKPLNIQAGSVVPIEDNGDHRIVLVTEATKAGNRVDMKGHLGDLRYVFSDTQFKLRIGPQDGGHSDEYVYPVDSYDGSEDEAPATKAEKHITLWDKPFSKDFTVWELKEKEYPEWMIKIPTSTKEEAKLTGKVEFIPNLTADIELTFGAPVEDFLDGVAFALAGAYDVKATINGDFHASLDFDFKYKMDDVWDGIVHGGTGHPRYFFDKSELLKHGILSKDFVFVLFGIPFDAHFGCNLMTEMKMTMLGEAELQFGIESDMSMMMSAKVAPYRDQILSTDKDFSISFDGHEPALSGKVSVDSRWYVYPHFYLWIDYAAGPAFDVKPYASVVFGEGGKKTFSELVSYDDYLTWETDGNFGVDLAMGISTPLENYFYEVDNTMKDLGCVYERPYLKSPSGLILEEGPGVIKAGEPAKYTFAVLGDFFGKKSVSWFPSIIKLDFPKSDKHDGLIPILGRASYTWTPQFADDEMVARVFDLDGKAVGQLQFKAAPGDYIKVTTVSVDSESSTAAKVSSTVETSFGLKEVGIVYSSTNETPVLGGDGCIKVISSNEGGSYVSHITNLVAKKKYHVRAYAIYERGETTDTAYGNTVTFIAGGSSGDGGGTLVDVPGENL